MNAECLCDHWNIGELEMLDENGESTEELIRSVECSYDYTGEALSVVHDGNWFHQRAHRRDRQAPQDDSAAPPQQQLMAVPMQKPALPVAGTCVVATCPTGLKPGDALQVAGPAGQMMQVQVPQGVAPGGQFAVQMPAAPVGMAAQPGVAMAAQVQATDPSGVVMAMPAAAHNTIAA